MAESVTETEVPVSNETSVSGETAARVEISPDKMRAVLYLRKGSGASHPLDMKVISQAIKESGVHGFNSEALKTTITAFLEGNERELKNYTLAEGTPSTRGKDREIELCAKPLPDEEKGQIAARLVEWNSRGALRDIGIDPLKAGGFAHVEKGTVAAKVVSGSEGEEGKDIFGNIVPGLPGNDPDIRLFNGLELHGSDITASQKGLLLFELSEKSFRGAVIDYQDALIKVYVSESAMEARGDFCREEGAGAPLTIENIKKVLTGMGVVKGIDWEAAEKACTLARRKGSVTGLVLARGKAPLARGDSAPRWLVSLNPPELPAENTTADSDGTGCTSVQVKAGAHILELSEPAGEAYPGYDVRGAPIPIERAAAFSIAHDDSVQEMAQGKLRLLVAARSGELVFDGKELKINSVRVIEGDAGPSAGTINFSGEIRINGNLLPGCAVIGGSHVTVEGLAEEALVSADGKAVVNLGIKGGDKGIIRARAGIEAAFAERASLLAVGDIVLKRGSIRSTIKTNGKIHVTGDNGKLSGGIYQARHGMDVMDAGSEKGVRTEISFGQDYIIKDQIITGEEEIVRLRRGLSEIELKVKEALDKKLPIPDEVRTEKVRLVKLMEQLNLKIFTLREKFEEHHESEVRIRGSIFPGVIMESHDRYYEVMQKRNRVIFYFDRGTGSIKEKPLDGA